VFRRRIRGSDRVGLGEDVDDLIHPDGQISLGFSSQNEHQTQL